jgi:hypothetical protein
MPKNLNLKYKNITLKAFNFKLKDLIILHNSSPVIYDTFCVKK